MELLVNILYAFPVYQSVILSILLFSGSKQQLSIAKLLMGIFQLLMAFYFSFNFLYSIRAFGMVAGIYFLILPVILLFIPVFYLYILTVTTPGVRLSKTHFIHFFPSLAISCLNIPYVMASKAEKLDFISHGYSILNNNSLFSYLLVVYMTGILGIFTFQLIYYSIKAFKLYRKHLVYIENRFSYTENINLDWLLALIICFVVFFVFNDILYLIGFRQQVFVQIIYNIAMLGITLYVGYRGLMQKDLKESDPGLGSIPELKPSTAFNKFENQNLNTKDDHVSLQPQQIQIDSAISKSESIKKYSGSSLTLNQKEELLIKLAKLMQHEKIFINHKLSIEDVAFKLESNTKYISQIINETYNKNFYNFINNYRIEEAKKLLLLAENEKYSILGIAQSVGFVSKSTFNGAFKRFTGLTPTEFKNKTALET
ncbi:MAG: helix-turn-helix domain-containing protein [Bacteroidales bacterium]